MNRVENPIAARNDLGISRCACDGDLEFIAIETARKRDRPREVRERYRFRDEQNPLARRKR